MSRSAIESDYEYDAYDDDYRGFEIRDDESNRGPLILALALGILIVFGAVVWNTYRQGVRPSENGLPVITAAETPYKRTPDDPGGKQTPDLNARIYDQIDGASRTDDSITLAGEISPQDQPELSPGDILQGGPSSQLASGQDPIVLSGAQKLETIRGGATEGERQQVASITPTLPTVTKPSLPDPIAPPPVEALPESRFAFQSDGNYLVQVSALRSSEAAERAWTEATRKSPDLFVGAQKRIQRADLGSKGVFYRLRVGAFAQRTDAAEFCNALKSAKHQCIVVQN